MCVLLKSQIMKQSQDGNSLFSHATNYVHHCILSKVMEDFSTEFLKPNYICGILLGAPVYMKMSPDTRISCEFKWTEF